MGWTMLYLFVFLKLPLMALFYLVWWAVHQTGDEVPEAGEGGSPREPQPRPHDHPKLPRAPRRGPHGDPAPQAPQRVRAVTARARELER
jgi:hypothetical protein